MSVRVIWRNGVEKVDIVGLESGSDIRDVGGKGKHHNIDSDTIFVLSCQYVLERHYRDSLHHAGSSLRILPAVEDLLTCVNRADRPLRGLVLQYTASFQVS